MARHNPKDFRIPRIGEIVRAEYDRLSTFTEARMQGWVLDQCAKTEIKCNKRKPIHLRPKVSSCSIRVLKVFVSCLATVAYWHHRDIHTVVVDQFNATR
jgi:hypothetical protein